MTQVLCYQREWRLYIIAHIIGHLNQFFAAAAAAIAVAVASPSSNRGSNKPKNKEVPIVASMLVCNNGLRLRTLDHG